MVQVIGINFDDEYATVSYIKKDKICSFKYKWNELIPTVIYFRNKEDYVIGEKAKNLQVINPSAAAEKFLSHLENNDDCNIVAEDGRKFKISPKAIISYFLNDLFRNIKEKFIRRFGVVDSVIDFVVISVPPKISVQSIESLHHAAAQART